MKCFKLKLPLFIGIFYVKKNQLNEYVVQMIIYVVMCKYKDRR